MKVRFRKNAITDLDGIVEWYKTVAPESVARIISDIDRAIGLLVQYPRSGPPIGIHGLRRKVTVHYRFKIAYRLLPTDDAASCIEVVGIFRFQDRST